MGTQFWWFFDAAAAATLLVFIYLAGKKGFSKKIIVLIGCILSFVISVPLSTTISGFFYNKAVSHTNSKAIEKALEGETMTKKTKAYIETLGYSVTVDTVRLNEIFSESGEKDAYKQLYNYVNNINGRVVDDEDSFRQKMQEGFSEIIYSIIAEELTSYEADAAAKAVLESESFVSELNVICGPDTAAAANIIENNYTAAATKDIIRIFCFIILVIVIMIFVKILAQLITGEEGIHSIGDIADHVAGGVIGLIEGAVVVFLAAALVRALVLLGSNEMLIFNTESIDKTIFFKYIYKFALKL